MTAHIHEDLGLKIAMVAGVVGLDPHHVALVVPERRTAQDVGLEHRRVAEQDLRAQQPAVGMAQQHAARRIGAERLLDERQGLGLQIGLIGRAAAVHGGA
ncbi:hypothetical protein D3C73_1465680 [compost metagenome]